MAADLVFLAADRFTSVFGFPPTFACSAPGRVNLMGDHCDYNQGYVLPIAIPQRTVIVGCEAIPVEGDAVVENPGTCRVMTMHDDAEDPHLVKFVLPDHKENVKPSSPNWINYILGIIANFHLDTKPFVCMIFSNIPLGAGLGSSCALGVAFYTFLELLNEKATVQEAKALRCQQAEHEFAHVQCGIMDQYSSIFAQRGKAMFIDCDLWEIRQIPFDDPMVTILAIDSRLKTKTIGDNEFSERRDDLDRTAEILGVKSLREATLDMLHAKASELYTVRFKRAHHVISEIMRTKEAAERLANKDYEHLGKLMNESHESLKTDFEVSCPEIDNVVEFCQKFDGVYGAKITGLGLGGCAVVLVKVDVVDDLKTAVQQQVDTGSFIVKCYDCKPSSGVVQEDLHSLPSKKPSAARGSAGF